ncbi:MAG: ANTAR domain-containing response regulator, partial [Butyricicoccus sp.]
EVRRTLREFFQNNPAYSVVGEASDGLDGVELCGKIRPDVALVDIQMPLLDGITTTRLLLAKGYARCVILLTAFDDRTYIEGALQAGAYGYLTKPFEPDKILPTLELCISRSREHHVLEKNWNRLTARENEREAVDRAKLLLMEARGMNETDAYRYIRELSRRKKMSMGKVSDYLIARLEQTDG